MQTDLSIQRCFCLFLLFVSLGSTNAGQTPCPPIWLGAITSPGLEGGDVLALAVYNDGSGNALYVGGSFQSAGGLSIPHIAKWDGESWSSVGGGIDGSVTSLAVHRDGSGEVLIVGGSFQTAGGMAASYIAAWDGASWSPLGTGIEGSNVSITAVASFDESEGRALIVGGSFEIAGGVPVSNIARFRNGQWSDISGGVNDRLFTLVVHDDGSGSALYAGGEFTLAGSVPVGLIAKWDGRNWAPAGNFIGTPFPSITGLGVFDEGQGANLFAAGRFIFVDGAPAVGIARWDGREWSALDGGLTVIPDTFDMTIFDDGSGSALYLGGAFTAAGGTVVNRIARWDGKSWSSLGTGTNDRVRALEVFEDFDGLALFAGGEFTEAGGNPVGHIIRWACPPVEACCFESGDCIDEPPSLCPILGGVSQGILTNCMEAMCQQLTTCCAFDGTCIVDAPFDPCIETGGTALGHGVSCGISPCAPACSDEWELPFGPEGVAKSGSSDDGLIKSILQWDRGSESPIFIGGYFDQAFGINAQSIAQWDEVAWSSVGGGLSGSSFLTLVDDMILFDDGSGTALYVTGDFTQAGATPAANIARWDGAEWTALGSPIPGTSGPIRSLAVFDDGRGPALYAGGRFQIAGLSFANNIARWDGTNWSALSSGISDGEIDSIIVFDDGSGPALYAAGAFAAAGGQPAQNIAKWNGREWSPLGVGTDGRILDLEVFDDGTGSALYAGGVFHTAGGIVARHAARWNGRQWQPVGTLASGASHPVKKFIVFDSGSGPVLYAGGEVSSQIQLARWNGIGWTTILPPQIGQRPTASGDIHAFLVDQSTPAKLYVAGDFRVGDPPVARDLITYSCITMVAGTGDFDGDGDVDLIDFAQFQICFTGADSSSANLDCTAFDSDGDDDIDLADFGSFQLAFTGPF